MNTQSPFPHTPRSRRARAVYGSQRTRRPTTGLIAAELGVLALVALAIAGSIGLRAWLSLG